MDKLLGKGPQRFFVTVRNADSVSLTEGFGLQWNANGTRDGIDAIKIASAIAPATFVGLVPEGKTIAVGYYGLAQVYGEHDKAVIYCHGSATNSNIAIGDVFVASSGGALTCVAAGAAATSCPPMIVAMATVGSASASSITSKAKVFLRCM